MRTDYSVKTGVFALCALLLFLVLAVRLFGLQVLEGGGYERLSIENRLRMEKVPSPRGIIFDRNGKPLVKNAPFFSIAFQQEMLGKADIAAIAEYLSMDAGEIYDRIKKEKNPFALVKLKDGLTLEEVARAEARLSDHPGLTIHVEQTRHYPYGETGAHLVGYLGRLTPRQLKRADFKGVPRQAFIGQWGMEKLFDGFLRGKPGSRAIEADALGRRLRLIKEEPPEHGSDLYLSIDINLQRAAEEAFGGRVGALAALKPGTGEVLALVSRPSFDPNLFSRGIHYEDWLRLSEDKRYPLLNRALQSQYPPGSTFKIITAIAALEEEAITPRTKSRCTGRLRKGRWDFGCWKSGGHGTLSLYRAIVESCDVYFYRAGEAAGIDNIARYARLFGLGSPSGLGLVREKKGLIPDTEWKKRVKNEPWFPGETYNAAIGQGFVLATPVQLARMTAAVANGGYLPELRLKRVEDEQAEPSTKIEVSEDTLEKIKKAMRGVVADKKGTAHWTAKSKMVDIAGKTGTAQVISLKKNRRKEEDTPYEFRDHAWFVAFAPVEEPEIAVAVFVEHGGHGGSAAAPIAKKAIEAYMKSLKAQSLPPEPAGSKPATAVKKPRPVRLKPVTTKRKPEPAVRKSTPATLKPEPAELKPKPVELEPEPLELEPEPTELKPEPVELEPEPTELKPEPVELKPEPVELKPEPVELEPEPAELEPEPAELKPEPAGPGPQAGEEILTTPGEEALDED
jgi:penicillin-binding protein 2